MSNPYDDEWCEERIEELEAENRELREASTMFGELAERLNLELRQERRSGIDRRVRGRETEDRRTAERK
jgi:hypothetical protein